MQLGLIHKIKLMLLRNLLICCGLFISFVCVSQNTISEVVETRWSGYLKGYYEGFEDPNYYMTFTISDMDYNDVDDIFTCSVVNVINIDYVRYSCTDHMTGKFDVDNFSLTFNYSYSTSVDQLPNELYWIHNNLSGTLFRDAEHEGYFVIEGSSDDSSFSICNYPE